MAGREHLHHDDVPATLAVLADLLDHRATLPDGYEPTESGAWVDWEALCASWLSATEVATVRIAQGCAVAERHGGLPLSVSGAVREAVDGLTGWWTAIPDPDRADFADGDGFTLVEPVGLDPYHPDRAAEVDDSGDDGGSGWWQGPAWSHPRRTGRRSPASFPEPPELGAGPDL